jgi:hypothetical protein
MNHLFVRRRTVTLAALSAAVLTTACEDKRLKQLDTGITRDSAVSVISHDTKPGAGPDSFPNVYKREKFLVSGKNYEVLYFQPENKKQPELNVVTKDTVPLDKLTPIVFIENRMIGKGWDFWDSVSKANHITTTIPAKK